MVRLQDCPLQGKRVLMRVDFNVPLNEGGSICDDTRIREALPTIQLILNQGASVILMSHLGRPKSKSDLQFSLGVCAKRLSQLISAPVFFASDCVGKEAEKLSKELKGGEVLLLENLRFYPAEEDPESDPSFAKKLASLGDFYVDDAFGSAHRPHASIVAVPSYFKGKSALGLLMEKELSFLEPLITSPARPFYVILGGAKVGSKMGVLEALKDKVDALFIGGGMAYTFLRARGLNIGKSIFDPTRLSWAVEFLRSAQKPIYLPIDCVITDGKEVRCIECREGIPDGWEGVDMGPKTVALWREKLKSAGTIFWNGPVGVYEDVRFAQGTKGLAEAVSSTSAMTIVGGGDSVAAVQAMHLGDKFSHLSTGGGASLEFLEKGTLPGLQAI